MNRVVCSVIAVAATTLAGCASSSNEIASSFSSPIIYESYSCQQIAYEDQLVISHATQLSGQINHNATNDKIAMGVGVVLFWPALFLLKGDGAQAAEYGQLKGQHEALQQASVMKGCMAGGQGYAPSAAYTGPTSSPTPTAVYQPVTAYSSSPAQQDEPSVINAPDQRVTDFKVVR